MFKLNEAEESAQQPRALAAVAETQVHFPREHGRSQRSLTLVPRSLTSLPASRGTANDWSAPLSLKRMPNEEKTN